MSKLRIAENLSLPSDAVTQTLVVYGGKGMGKTNFGTVLCEELAAAKLRFAVIDPMGVFWGLRHSDDGKGSGIEVLILGGRHGDIPIEPTAGAVVADLVADEDADVIIDISRKPDGTMWSIGERIRFVADYSARLYQRQGERCRPLMQIIDEAGRFAQEQVRHGDVDAARCLGAVATAVEEGRNVGLGVCLITQRSARMSKAVSELADCMIAFRTVGPRSVDAILDWFGEHVEKARWKELIEQLRSLPRGTALVVSPGWLGFEGQAQIRKRDTFDSSATPKVGQERRAAGKGARPDLARYLERMAATIERAKAEDPRELRRRITELEAATRKAKPATAAAPDPAAVERAREEGRQAGYAEGRADGIKTVRALIDPHLKQIDSLAEKVGDAVETLSIEVARPQAQKVVASAPVSSPKVRAPEPVMHEPRRPAPSNGSGNANLTGPESRILNAIAWLEGLGIAQPEQTAVAFLAGYTIGGGAFNNPRGSLRTKGLVEYVGSDRIVLTDAGRAFAEHPDVALTTEELQRKVLERLPGPEQRILNVLIRAYPNPVRNDECARAAGYEPGGGAFNNPRGRLRTLGLIEYPQPGMIVARPLLFLEGR